jgi:hypothetical protein
MIRGGNYDCGISSNERGANGTSQVLEKALLISIELDGVPRHDFTRAEGNSGGEGGDADVRRLAC